MKCKIFIAIKVSICKLSCIKLSYKHCNRENHDITQLLLLTILLLVTYEDIPKLCDIDYYIRSKEMCMSVKVIYNDIYT